MTSGVYHSHNYIRVWIARTSACASSAINKIRMWNIITKYWERFLASVNFEFVVFVGRPGIREWLGAKANETLTYRRKRIRHPMYSDRARKQAHSNPSLCNPCCNDREGERKKTLWDNYFHFIHSKGNNNNILHEIRLSSAFGPDLSFLFCRILVIIIAIVVTFILYNFMSKLTADKISTTMFVCLHLEEHDVKRICVTDIPVRRSSHQREHGINR